METWFISDTHFSHRNIIKFTDNEGKLIRPFSSVEEMDELMVERWNSRINKKDRVYHLGDVVINRKALSILDRLNGRKVLIKGNHDIFKLKDYVKYFDDIRAYKIFPVQGIICSHIPIHTNQLQHRFKWNIHGHLHQNIVKKENNNNNEIDKRYINVCVEQTDYYPVSWAEIIKHIGWENPQK